MSGSLNSPEFIYSANITESDVKPDNQERRTAIFKNSHLRLLMTLSGLRLLEPTPEETPQSLWIMPADISADHLKDTIHFINQAEFSPPTFDDGVLAENQLKRKAAPRKKAAFDDDDDENDDDGIEGDLDDDILFPAGGPTARKVADEKKKKQKKSRRRKRQNSQSEEPDDAELEEKARKRRERELEKARKIKSTLYVRDGDDDFDSEEDEAFFARERAIAARAQHAAASATGVTDPVVAAVTKKRKSEVMLAVSDDDNQDEEDEDEDDGEMSFARRVLSSQEGVESETDDTPVDISDGENRKRRKTSVDVDDVNMDGGDADVAAGKIVEWQAADDDEPAVVVTRRPRVRGGFVIDSDDDE